MARVKACHGLSLGMYLLMLVLLIALFIQFSFMMYFILTLRQTVNELDDKMKHMISSRSDYERLVESRLTSLENFLTRNCYNLPSIAQDTNKIMLMLNSLSPQVRTTHAKLEEVINIWIKILNTKKK